ncbi:MAG: hypothetical protein BGN88_07005 [Clostridiales bacterium 43-6]|nr:MAG: hypothetical protein BGN88_07005 [Clostridiales bacterium 43-6]
MYEDQKDLTVYAYDNLNRLERETYVGFGSGQGSVQWQSLYSFDDHNNVTEKAYEDCINTANTKTTSNTFDSANQITGTTVRDENDDIVNTYRYLYDEAGNLQNQDEFVNNNWVTRKTYGYDTLNRTSDITVNTVTTSFEYDANDQRIQKNGTSSIWNGGRIICDYGNETWLYLQDNLGYLKDGQIFANSINAQGDVVSTVHDANGQKVTTGTDFDAYGNKTAGDETNYPFGYRGYYTDYETGLYYLNARYYDPGMQRFTQEDTVQDDNLAYNMYGYCSGNPVMYTDPSGHVLMVKADQNGRNAIAQALKNLTSWRIDWVGVDVRNGVYKLTSPNGKLTATTPKGDLLISRLINNKSFTCTITLDYSLANGKCTPINREDACGTKGSGSTVVWNPNYNPNFLCYYKDYNNPTSKQVSTRCHPTKTPNYIILGHELIHADRAMSSRMIVYWNGTADEKKRWYTDANGKTQWENVRVEELATVGLDENYINKNIDVTENMLREEHKLSIRGAYKLG